MNINKLKFPLVVKPSDRSAGRGVVKVNNTEELKIAYKNATESFKEGTKGMNLLGKSMKGVGKGLGPLGVGIVAADNYKTYKGDTQKVVVGTVVDTAFSSGAAAAGATVGSMLFPPIGTVVGAVTGVLVSSTVNGKYGKPPKSITDHTKDLVNKGVNSFENFGKSVVKFFK